MSSGRLVIYALLGFAAVFTLGPFVWMLSNSFMTQEEIAQPEGVGLIPEHPTLDNYRFLIARVPFATYVVNTVFVDNPGTGIRLESTGSLEMSYATIADNGTGFDTLSSSLTVDHSIIYGNTTDVSGTGCTPFTFSDLGIDCTGSGGNISAAPEFVNPAVGDYHLTDLSPVLDASRALVDLAARCIDAGDEAGRARRLVSEAKKFVTEAGWEIINHAMQIMGGIGYTNVYPIERLLRDARLSMIWTGTSEIMNLIIQHEYYRELGLPSQGRDVEADAPDADKVDEKVYE